MDGAASSAIILSKRRRTFIAAASILRRIGRFFRKLVIFVLIFERIACYCGELTWIRRARTVGHGGAAGPHRAGNKDSSVA
jgi:hypothetical protein